MSQGIKPLPRATFEAPVRGITAEGLDISKVDVGDFVYLKNEPDNPADFNAVVVLAQDGTKLGYLPKDIAARMDPSEWEGVVKTILVYEDKAAGLRLQVRPYLTDEAKGVT